MKKLFRTLAYLSLFASLIVIGSCAEKTLLESSDLRDHKDSLWTRSDPQQDSRDENIAYCDEEVLRYFDNIKTIMYLTNSFNPENVKVPYEEVMDNDSLFYSSNYISYKLQSLLIEDDSTGVECDFFDFSPEEQDSFIEFLLKDEAKDINSKIAEVPELKEYLIRDNEVISNVLESHSGKKLKIGVAVNRGENFIGSINAQTFFSDLTRALETSESEFTTDYSTGEDDGSVSAVIRKGVAIGDYKEVDPEVVRKAWAKSARRGDIILALPKQGYPFVYANISNKAFMVGHAGIINSVITEETSTSDSCTVECWMKDGVTECSIETWKAPHYVMGVQKITYRWKWKGLRSGFYKKKQKVSNPEALADEAETYLGKDYVKWYEFATAKWAAPHRFTCTSLVWWCAKKVYGENLSHWYSPLVSPSAIYLNSSTYVRYNVYGNKCI